MYDMAAFYEASSVQDAVALRLAHPEAQIIAGGTDVATVAGLLGHSQPSTTLDIYTHAFDKNKRAASEALHRGLEI